MIIFCVLSASFVIRAAYLGGFGYYDRLVCSQLARWLLQDVLNVVMDLPLCFAIMYMNYKNFTEKFKPCDSVKDCEEFAEPLAVNDQASSGNSDEDTFSVLVDDVEMLTSNDIYVRPPSFDPRKSILETNEFAGLLSKLRTTDEDRFI